MRQRIELVFLLFFVSGFGGLIYESVWTHYVKLFLGHAAYAQTLVLVVFIGGLALGSWLCSRYAKRFANPLRAYAYVEAATGLIALVFQPVFVAATDWAYAWLLPATCDPSTTLCVSQWLLSASLLAPQSILLGATFPLVSSAVLRLSSERAGHDISTLYFLNSLGATMGVLASAFLLIPSVGLPGTLRTAAAANLAVALGAFLLSRRAPAPLAIAQAPAHATGGQGDSRFVKILLATAALTGLSSFIYEIAWVRMLSAVLGASTYSFELMLASFILGLAIGGWWIRRRIDAAYDSVRLLAVVQIVMGVAAAATLPLYAFSFDLMAWLISSVSRNEGGFVLFNLTSTTIALVVMLPATICAGMTLPLITYRLLRSPEGERSLGRVYAVNTAGSIVGVILAVHFLMPLVGVKATLITGCVIDVALGLGLLVLSSRAASWKERWPAFAAMAALAFFAIVIKDDPHRSASGVFRTGSAHIGTSNAIVYHHDGKTATVDVIDSVQNRSIRTNGKPDAAISMKDGYGPTGDEYTMLLLAALPMGHVPGAKSAAVIGFGSGMSTSMLLTSPYMTRVDTIEIEPSMAEGARAFLPFNAAAYDDPRSHIVFDDAKSYFARGHTRYDIIVSEPSNPWVSGVSSLFTTEFYRRISTYLNEGGVFSQWLHTYEIDSETLASIVRAVSVTFPDYVIYTTIDADLVLIARKAGKPGRFDPSVLAYPKLQPMLDRLLMGDVQSIERRAVARGMFMTPFFATFGAPANSDYFPYVDHRTGKARFTRPRVQELTDLQTAPVPLLEMIDGAYRPASRRVRTYAQTEAELASEEAWILHDALLATGPSRATTPMVDPREIAAQLTRLWATDCKSGLSFHQVLPAMVEVARVLNPSLDSKLAAEAWKPVLGSPCGAALAPEERAWLDLIGAVARRDPTSMESAGMKALEGFSGPASVSTEYAFAAAATAMVCRNEFAEARAFIRDRREEYVRGNQLGAETRLLRALAWSDTPLHTACGGPAATSVATGSR
ncbi:MAG TPA: fused MFS/spermidine synthase [Usitatibacter sp.]|nr:fused MFS/spermidine synthase [Usitatibacter sp.]